MQDVVTGRAGRPLHAVRRARSDAPYQKSLTQPSLTKYFPGNCLTRRFSSNCNNVDETAALGNSLFAAISSIEVSVASIASYTRRSSLDSGGHARAAAWGAGFVSGGRTYKSPRMSLASITS